LLQLGGQEVWEVRAWISLASLDKQRWTREGIMMKEDFSFDLDLPAPSLHRGIRTMSAIVVGLSARMSISRRSR